MKKTSFLLFALWCLLSCGVHHKMDNPYNNAYKYIVKDMMTKDRYVAVMDSLDECDQMLFAEWLPNVNTWLSIHKAS